VNGPVRLDAHTRTATEFEYEELLTRQAAAERLADIAYALTGGETLELRRAGEQVSVPVPGEVQLIRRSTSTHGRVEIEIRLSWSLPDHRNPGVLGSAGAGR
jgi:amphi-Trp domain-containing protein